MAMPTATTTVSSRMMPKATPTAPIDGRVSSPEKGGATAAAVTNCTMNKPSTLMNQVCPNSLRRLRAANRGASWVEGHRCVHRVQDRPGGAPTPAVETDRSPQVASSRPGTCRLGRWCSMCSKLTSAPTRQGSGYSTQKRGTQFCTQCGKGMECRPQEGQIRDEHARPAEFLRQCTHFWRRVGQAGADRPGPPERDGGP